MRPKGSAVELEVRRRIAADLLRDGKSIAEVARLLHVHRSSVKRWKKALSLHGDQGIVAKPHPGRRPKLNEKQKAELVTILRKGPLAAGFRTDLWTCRRVAEVVHRRFGVKYNCDHLGRLLHRLGFTPQKPEQRARERDEAAIRRWRQVDWPRIKKRGAGRRQA